MFRNISDIERDLRLCERNRARLINELELTRKKDNTKNLFKGHNKIFIIKETSVSGHRFMGGISSKYVKVFYNENKAKQYVSENYPYPTDLIDGTYHGEVTGKIIEFNIGDSLDEIPLSLFYEEQR